MDKVKKNIMRIAMIVPSLANKGPVIVAKDLCEQFVKMGHTCIVYYFDDILELEMPCEVKQISFWRSIDFNKWDVVHTHGLRPDCYVRLHKPIISHTKTNFVTTLHNPISTKAAMYSRNLPISIIISVLWHIALTAFDNIVFLNRSTKQNTFLLKETNLHIVYNGRNIDTKTECVSANHRKNILDLKNKYKIIGTISNIEKRKGLEQLVYALVHLPECAAVIVGDGDDRCRLEELSKRLNVNDRCYWVGYQSLAHCYHRYFDLFVMCTRSEGFPLALVESAAHGTPTVLSNIPILTSIIKEPIVEFYQLDNISSLCGKINKVLMQKQEYSYRIKVYYNHNLTASIMADKYLKLYKSSIC